MIRVWYSADQDVVVVGGGRPFPANSLTYISNSDGTVELWTFGSRVLGPVPYETIQDSSGNAFSSQSDLASYLDGVVTRRETLGSGLLGQAGGLATLDSSGLVPAAQLPPQIVFEAQSGTTDTTVAVPSGYKFKSLYINGLRQVAAQVRGASDQVTVGHSEWGLNDDDWLSVEFVASS